MTRQQTRTRTPPRKSYRKSRASRGKGSARKTKPKQKSHKKKQSLRHGFHRMLSGGMDADEAKDRMLKIKRSYIDLEPIYKKIFLKFKALGKVGASKVAEAERVAKVADKTAVQAINNALDALRALKAPGQGPAQEAEAAVGSAEAALEKFKKAIQAVDAEVDSLVAIAAGNTIAQSWTAGGYGAGAAVSLLSGSVADGTSDGLTRRKEWSVNGAGAGGVPAGSGGVPAGAGRFPAGSGAGGFPAGSGAAPGASPIPTSSSKVSTIPNSPSSSTVQAILNSSSSIINTIPAVTSAPAGKGALESVTKAKSATIVSSVPVTQDQILKKQIGDAGPAEADVTSDGLTVTAVPAGKIYGVTGTQLLMGMGAAGLLGYNVLHHKSKTKNTAK